MEPAIRAERPGHRPARGVAPIVVIGWGNPSRGDDALGWLLCDRLEAWLAGSGHPGGCEVIRDFQLQVEHALDLVGRRLALFVDATVAAGDPDRCALRRLHPRRDASHTTHALSPQALLAVYSQIDDRPPPPACLLALGGVSFELGDGLSPTARRQLDAGFALARRLIARALRGSGIAQAVGPDPSAARPDRLPVADRPAG